MYDLNKASYVKRKVISVMRMAFREKKRAIRMNVNEGKILKIRLNLRENVEEKSLVKCR